VPGPVHSSGTLRLLYLGRLTELSKRARSIVLFAKALETSRIPYAWTVAGDGDEADYLRHALVEHGIINTRLVGPVPRANLPKLFEEHDVIVSTSEREAFPLGLQESMAHGLVPVAVAAPGRVEEVVAQAKGFLIDVDDADGFAQSIGTLATNRMLLEDLSGAAAAAISQDLGWKQIASDWDKLLEEFPLRGSSGSWPARLRVLPNLTPLFRGCPQALTELIDQILFRVENLDVGLVRRIRRAGYRLRRMYANRGNPGK
jgi:glycosyltransferase involved in cell wall biosynthesis